MSMEYSALGDYCTVTSSKRIFAEQYVESGVPFYRSREIIEKNNNSDISEPLFISPEVYENIKMKFGVPHKGDMLLTSVGTIGIPYIARDEQFYFKDGNLTWMKDFSDKLSSKYLYYWLSSKFGRESLINRCIGSSQSALTIDILKKYKLLVPNRETQDEIVSILSAYDDLIEVNNKRIKALEQMAENLYKEWFVRFRFPGHETTEFEDGIPKGWKKIKIKDIAQEVGVSEKAENRAAYSHYLPIDTLPPRSMALKEEEDIENAESSLESFKAGDILFGAMRPYFHKVLIAPFDGLTRSTCFIIDAKKAEYRLFLYFLLFSDSTIDFATTVSVGSTMPYVRWKDLERMYFIKPEIEIVKKFNEITAPIVKRIVGFYRINSNLIRQRDLLLPRLMSGKLEVRVTGETA